jgi:hypothetical protein
MPLRAAVFVKPVDQKHLPLERVREILRRD